MPLSEGSRASLEGLTFPPSPPGVELPVADRVAYLCKQHKPQNDVIDTEDQTILIDVPPRPYRHPNTGEVVGYEMFIRAFDASGDKGVDPHRVFINPPDGRRKLDSREIVTDVDAVVMVRETLTHTVKSSPGRAES
jgi:hypothetical protein